MSRTRISVWKNEARKKEPEKKPTLKEQGFYHTPSWRRVRLKALQRDHYLCQNCLKNNRIKLATEVHHIKPLEEYPELALVLDNITSLCWDCHEQTKHRKSEPTPRGVRVIKVSDGRD